MYVNPFPFGIFIGVISTIVAEVVGLVIWALCVGGKDDKH